MRDRSRTRAKSERMVDSTLSVYSFNESVFDNEGDGCGKSGGTGKRRDLSTWQHDPAVRPVLLGS